MNVWVREYWKRVKRVISAPRNVKRTIVKVLVQVLKGSGVSEDDSWKYRR